MEAAGLGVVREPVLEVWAYKSDNASWFTNLAVKQRDNLGREPETNGVWRMKVEVASFSMVAGIFVLGLAIYYIAKTYRLRREGLDLGLLIKDIPLECH